MQTFGLSLETEAASTDDTQNPCAESTGAGRYTIGGELQRLAQLQPDHAAVVASGSAPLSYRRLHNLACDVRTALRLGRFERSARIAIAMGDGAQAAVAIVAVSCSAVSVPLNPKQTAAEIDACLARVRPHALLVASGIDSVARRAAERQGIPLIEATAAADGTPAFSLPMTEGARTEAPEESDDPDPDASAFILQTSGTAAEPKLVPYSHRNMLATAAIAKAWYNLTPQDRCLSVSPVFYAHGLKVTVFTPLLTGGTVTFPADASKFDYSEWFGVLKPTWYSAGPTLNRFVFDQIQSSTDVKSDHSLRFITMGLAAAPRDVLEGLQRTLGIPVLACYGASEASVISSNQPTQGRARAGTVGLPWPNTVVIAGEDGHPLPPGIQGEILVGGPTVISGYLNAPELNRMRFVNGWFKTGDIGSIDEEGFLTVRGRKDDLINRGGEKISPAEIDDLLVRHPAVAEAAAFAVPHPRLGEDVAVAAVLRPGTTATAIQLREFLQQRLASFKIPRRILIRDQLPKGPTGKIARRQLTELLQGEVAADTPSAAPQDSREAPFDCELVLQLTKMWEELLKITPIFLDDDFFEKGGDSLLAMQMHAKLEELTCRTIPGAMLFEATTIRQVAQLLSSGGKIQEKPLIRLHQTGSRPPLFFFHSEFEGEGYSAIRLARLLGSDQPFFVVDPHGLDDQPVPRSIEAMAADRMPLILNAQPEEPYRLFGSCVGGLVAFELARLLVAANKKVDVVIMVDPPVISARKSVQFVLSKMRSMRPLAGPLMDRAMAWTFRRCADIEKFNNISWTRRWAAIRTRMQRLAGGITEPSPSDLAVANRDANYEIAMSNYVPKQLAVPVIYFSVDYPGEPWQRISPNLEIIKSPGNHFDLDFADIAKHLQVRLEAGSSYRLAGAAQA